MGWILLLIVIMLAVYLPSWWVRRVMQRYGSPEDRYASTGADLARHLLAEHGLTSVGVELTEQGDHYDPMVKVVRLAPERYHGRSLTAVTVAAHEVGHALQDAGGYRPLAVRTRLITMLRPLERFGALVLMGAPLIAILTRLPSVTALVIVGGLMTLGTSTIVHLVTLPTEWNASFARAMPMLERDGILLPADHPHARKILLAAAMTYVAVSLMSLLNVARWWALIRR
jgi:Zn-dependent membrane protease YugP